MNENFSFENLIVYQKTLEYIDWVYEVTSSFPQKEIYALTSQFIRASQSIALNIEEGSGGTTSEFISFLRIARCSVNECIVCSTIAYRQKYFSEKINNDSRVNCAEISKMINGLLIILNAHGFANILCEIRNDTNLRKARQFVYL